MDALLAVHSAVHSLTVLALANSAKLAVANAAAQQTAAMCVFMIYASSTTMPRTTSLPPVLLVKSTPWAGLRSPGIETGRLDQLVHVLHLVDHELAHLRRCAAGGDNPVVGQLPDQLRGARGRHELPVQFLDGGGGRSRRCQQAAPVAHPVCA